MGDGEAYDLSMVTTVDSDVSDATEMQGDAMGHTPDQEKQRVLQLVQAAQGGCRKSFGELFERYERHVFAVALRRIGDYGEAQDLVQDVFTQVMLKIDQLRQPECFGGWIRSITHRMAINRIVRRGPDVPMDPDTAAAVTVNEETPVDIALESERDSEMHAGLNRLKDLDRATLEAFYVKGHSLIEMSDEFDAPIGTIKRRLHVARKRLGKEVEHVMLN